jgi:hypothetical protein
MNTNVLSKSVMARKSLLLKILAGVLLVLLLCNLPGEILFWRLCNEQDRDIPPNTEVIVSACERPIAIGVPGGDALFVQEGRSGKMYLLDLRTREKRKVPNDPLLPDKGIFLSSELVWLRGYTAPPGSTGSSTIPHYILDLTDGQRYELFDITWLPRLEDGKFDPKNYIYFQSAERVFIHHTQNILIALFSDFRTNPNGRVIFLHDSKSLEQLMKELGVKFEIVDLSTTRYADIPSPTGRYVVRNDGIYLSKTNTPVVTREYTGGAFMGGYFKSWYYDESGVVVQENSTYLIKLLPGAHYYLIPRPILKLHIPASS